MIVRRQREIKGALTLLSSLQNCQGAGARVLGLAAQADIQPEFQEFELKDANRARLKSNRVKFEGRKFCARVRIGRR